MNNLQLVGALTQVNHNELYQGCSMKKSERKKTLFNN